MKIILLLFVILVLIIYIYIRQRNEQMIDIPNINQPAKWTVNKNCNYVMGETIKDILKENNIEHTDSDDWILYLPCTYNNLSKEINDVKPKNTTQRIFLIDNADEISGKDSLWSNLVSTYGKNNASQLMPRTYILSEADDRKLFENEYDPNKLYIMKKNIQRQEGLLITKDKNKILHGDDDGYVIVQELLQDPYLIDGRKINMRFYLLVVCKDGEIDAYVHKNGFMYYTAEKFKKNSTEDGPNITTGYIDRQVYIDNPLTHDDLRKYLDDRNRQLNKHEIVLLMNNERISDVLFESAYDVLADAIASMKGKICHKGHLKSAISFQLFGADIAINDRLEAQLMEINKGPDLGAKDERDKQVKHKVVTDMLKVMKIIPDSNNEFIKILD